MGDISEMRGLIVAITFIAITIALIGWIVAESPLMFLGPVTEGSSSVPDSTTAPTDLLSWNSTYTLNLTQPLPGDYHQQIGGWNYEVLTDILSKGVSMNTHAEWGPFQWDTDWFKWYKNGVLVSNAFDNILMTRLDADFAADNGLNYDARNSKTETKVNFVFNESLYATPGDAYDALALSMVFKIDFDDRNTSINTLNLLTGLFTFTLPGIDARILLLIMSPLIIASAYMVFIFVLRIIGSVFGGGGA